MINDQSTISADQIDLTIVIGRMISIDHLKVNNDHLGMRGGTVQIVWHDSKPVLTVDFHSPTGLLATGGADHDIKLWVINPGESQKKGPTASYQSSLSYHSSAVNVLRFSPTGDSLASGADGGELIIWKLHYTDEGHMWKLFKTLSYHRKDVLDLEWSADGAYLVSGSVDNSCIIWDASKGAVHQILDAHLHYVQGVAWDPLGHYLASLSSDRTCRIYANKPQPKTKGFDKVHYVCQHVITKSEPKKLDDSMTPSTKTHLFHDEILPSFFRRLMWSPDGSFLLVPAGDAKKAMKENMDSEAPKPETTENMDVDCIADASVGGAIEAAAETRTEPVKETPLSSAKPADSSKPARKRITPVAIVDKQ
ncbi:hypothetical protein QJS04_geneDACA009024 [Acorus gramineus]|uniref:CAF-1 p60 homolog n=1 Tax=Acorus gramineus TaxID=55184 RepID=A0AAV9ARL9_ACOGR|nr:hypothetical protein QJS04_geneDACA009024 [Acorus gramineus]